MNNSQTPERIRCAVYDRVSTDIQAQHGLSLDTQKELLTEYALSHGYEIVDYYVDEGLTARKKLQNRKEFMRLLDDIRRDKIDLVLVTKLDRWFRNVKDYHNTQAVLEEHHCNWKTILEDYDTSTADGQLKINIMLAVAQNESDRTSERIKVVFEHKKRNQEHLSGPVPFGYIVVDKRLQKDENTRAVTENIFRRYFACLSKRKTITYIQSHYQDCSPSAYQISHMLSNEIYAGMRYGREGYCEPYITPEQHLKILSICSSKTYPSTKEPYLFSQLLKCPCCGYGMTGFVKKHKCKDGNVSCYKRYRCGRKSGGHTGACISESVIETYMLEHLYPESEGYTYKIRQAPNKSESKSREKSIREIKSEMERLNFLFQKGRISQDYYEKQYQKLERSLRHEKNAVQKESANSLKKSQKEAAAEICGNWKVLYGCLDYEHRKCFWKQILAEINIDQETHKISGFRLLKPQNRQ